MKELLTPYATTKEIADAANDLELRVSLIESLIVVDEPPEGVHYEPSNDDLERVLNDLVDDGLIEQIEVNEVLDELQDSPAQRMSKMLDQGLEDAIATLCRIIKHGQEWEEVISATRALADIYFTFSAPC